MQFIATPQSLAKAIDDLAKRFPNEYPAILLKRELNALKSDDKTALRNFAVKALVRLNPALAKTPILYTTRKQFRRDHHNTATMFQYGEINQHAYDTNGKLKILYPASGETITLLDCGPTATIRDTEIDYDAKSLLLSIRKDKKDDYHIYLLDIATTKLTQLTSAPGVSDIDPQFLPSGQIVFTSTREPKYCMCNRHIMGNLFRMERDGSNIIQIGKSTLHEGHATILPDGRILYDRWEYVDRNFGDAQGLWTCNPDGTRHAIFWGNNTQSPGGVIDARPLSKPGQVIAVLSSCHDRPWGALGIIDRAKGVDGPTPVLKTWPESFISKIHTARFGYDSTVSLPIKYEDPFPISDEQFLCVRTIGKGEETAIYYLDLFGNEIPIHMEAPGCFDPIPLKPHPKQPVITEQRNFDSPNAPGRFYLQNVYDGTHMKGVKPGSIRAIRIVESPEKRSWSRGGWHGQGEQAPAMNWHNFENKRILGTVPIEKDGSAYFEVPANTFVFFQALDENGMMVQSMRSGAYLQPGELTGCTGCHENRIEAVPTQKQFPIAMKRPPSKLNGWHGKPRFFDFQTEVQPVFDRHCIQCHDYGKKPAEKLNLAGDKDFVFATSYTDLWATGNVKCVGGGPAEVQQAYSWGSHPSKLTKKLLDNHHGKNIPNEDIERIITWLDLNAPYYPVYDSAYPQNPTGRSPLTKQEIQRIETLAKTQIHIQFYKRQRAQFSFDRPECSRILQAPALQKDENAYCEVLALIKLGAQRLQQTPRADMKNFRHIPIDVKRHDKYLHRLQQELKSYDAIRKGAKTKD